MADLADRGEVPLDYHELSPEKVTKLSLRAPCWPDTFIVRLLGTSCLSWIEDDGQIRGKYFPLLFFFCRKPRLDPIWGGKERGGSMCGVVPTCEGLGFVDHCAVSADLVAKLSRSAYSTSAPSSFINFLSIPCSII